MNLVILTKNLGQGVWGGGGIIVHFGMGGGGGGTFVISPF